MLTDDRQQTDDRQTDGRSMTPIAYRVLRTDQLNDMPMGQGELIGYLYVIFCASLPTVVKNSKIWVQGTFAMFRRIYVCDMEAIC